MYEPYEDRRFEEAIMAKFSVRVELHAASYVDYEKLHASMERRGFSRMIKADGGKTYHLPTAEYDGAAT